MAILNSTTIEISELPIRTWTQVSNCGFLCVCVCDQQKHFFVQMLVDYSETYVSETYKRTIISLDIQRTGPRTHVKRHREDASSHNRLQGIPHRHHGEVCGEDDWRETGWGRESRTPQSLQTPNQPHMQLYGVPCFMTYVSLYIKINIHFKRKS